LTGKKKEEKGTQQGAKNKNKTKTPFLYLLLNRKWKY
jgi:hypothetical protein